MTEYQVTIDATDLPGLFHGDDGGKVLMEKVFNPIFQAQAADQVQYERTDDRRGYRNGTRARQLTTRVGTLTLRIPQLREGQLSTELCARYQRREQALVLALMEMVVNGGSTRKIRAITEELCGTAFSKSTVSAQCQRLDPVVTAWNTRPLRDQRAPLLLVDALVLRIREDGRCFGQFDLAWDGLTGMGSKKPVASRCHCHQGRAFVFARSCRDALDTISPGSTLRGRATRPLPKPSPIPYVP